MRSRNTTTRKHPERSAAPARFAPERTTARSRRTPCRLQLDAMPWVYMLRCSDNSLYVGMTKNLDIRYAQHIDGTFGGYTAARRPVLLVWQAEVQTANQAFELDRKLKGWSRAKKEALIQGDFVGIHEIVAAERKRREQAKRQRDR